MPTFLEMSPIIISLFFLVLQVYDKKRTYFYSIACLSLNLFAMYFVEGLSAVLGIILVLFYILHFTFQKQSCVNEKCFHLLFSLFWGLSFFVATSPITEAFCLIGFFINAFFVRLVHRLDRVNIKENLSYLAIAAPMVLFVFLSNITSDAFFLTIESTTSIAMLLIIALLVCYFYLQTMVIDRNSKEGFYYALIVLVSISLMLVKVLVSYGLTDIRVFEEPYRYRYLSWLIFLASLLLPLVYFIRGGLLDKFYSLSHLVIMSSLLLLIRAEVSMEARLSVVIVSIFVVFLWSLNLNASGQWKSQKASLLFLLATLMALSPANYALQHLIDSLVSSPYFWEFRAEIFYFPQFLVLLPLGLSLIYALVLGSDFMPSFDLAAFKKDILINKESLLALVIFVLGIYPFPLYIYIQFIMNR